MEVKVKLKNEVKQPNGWIPKWHLSSLPLVHKCGSLGGQYGWGLGVAFGRGVYCTEEKIVNSWKKHNELLNIFRRNRTSEPDFRLSGRGRKS